MIRDIRDIAAAALFGLLLLWATMAHACGFGYSTSFVAAYQPQVVAVAAVQYQYAAVAVAVPQVAVVAAAVPCPQYAQAAQLPAFAPEATPYVMPYAQTLGVNALGYNSVGFNSFGFNSYGYGANVNVFAGRRAFFRSDFNSGVNVNVFSGRRGFFANRGVRSVTTRSVTRTRVRVR